MYPHTCKLTESENAFDAVNKQRKQRLSDLTLVPIFLDELQHLFTINGTD